MAPEIHRLMADTPWMSEAARRFYGEPEEYLGKDAYRDSSEQFLSGIRRRDEIWMRLRWTF